MYPFLLGIHAAGRGDGLAACQLRYRFRGFNEGEPVHDVRWALGEIRRRHGDVPVCLVGHSMGARSVLRAAGEEQVRAVAALAPWLPPGEPVDQLAGRTVVIMHGRRDRVTNPAGSLRYALEAHPVAERLCRFEIARSGQAVHALVARHRPVGRAVPEGVRAASGRGLQGRHMTLLGALAAVCAAFMLWADCS
jgi:dienelactone hydrolase